MNTIRIPPFVKPGATIAITAPSFGCTTEPYSTKLEKAIKTLEGRGYKTVIGPTVRMNDGKGISTNPKTAAKELEEFYADPGIDAIISAGGGEMMCETAGFIDFERLAALPPKFFMGYSDNTNFLFPLSTICRTAGIYSHCIGGFGKEWEASETDSIELLEGTRNKFKGYDKFQLPENDELEDQTGKYQLTEKKELANFIPKNGILIRTQDETIRMEGILLGGCLDVLANLCGTKLDRMKEFQEVSKKTIWALESCDGNPMEIRRQIWHLKNAGWFDSAEGFIVGRPLSSFRQEMMGVNQYNAVTDILEDLGKPVIMDADFGHIAPMIPLMTGATASISATGNSLEISYSF